MKVIVNADDLGLTAEANRAIRMCMEQGLVCQTTLVVNSEHTEEGAAIAHELGCEGRVGLHLNLSECRPLSSAISELPGYVSNGLLCHMPRFMDKATYGISPLLTYADAYRTPEFAQEVRAVREEVKAQVDRFCSLGFEPIHIDSHANQLVDLPVWLAARPVIEDAGFKTMRCTFDSFATDDLYNEAWRLWLADQRASAGLTCVGYSSSVPRFMRRRAELEAGPEAGQTIEIYVHPIEVDGVLIDNMTGGRRLDDDLAELEGIERTSFFELAELAG